MQIRRDDLTTAEIQALLAAHVCNMHELSSPASMHALNFDGLRQPDVTFWSVWEGHELLGCGAVAAGSLAMRSTHTASS